MLTGSEAEDTTSEESSESSDDEDKGKKEEPGTSKIEWSQLELGKRLVQEIKEDQPKTQEPPQEYWCGYRGDLQPGTTVSPDFTADFQAINNLLFNQTPHVERKSARKVLEELKKTTQPKIVEVSEEETNTHVAKQKQIDEITEETENSPEINEKSDDANKNLHDFVQKTGIVFEGDKIIDHDKKTITQKGKAVESEVPIKKPMKRITIVEIPLNENQEVGKGNAGENKEDSKEDKGQTQDQSNNHGSTGSQENRSRPQESTDGAGPALINYMHRLNDPDYEGSGDLEPSAEDLEIFAELEREEVERQARVARGEPAVDPMKLYDKKTMDAYYKAEEQLPAHRVTEKILHTTYKHDNAFDRIALSQLTGGERQDETKVKLTHIPGATLFQYVDKQTPTQLEYEIGEEKVDSGPSSGETDSINISSDSDSSDEVVVKVTEKPKPFNPRPSTASSRRKSIVNTTVTVDNSSQSNLSNDELPNIKTPMSDKLTNEDRTEAKKCIINTINSYEDERFPSQGNLSNMEENNVIEQSVASEILERTLQHEENEFYRQCDLINNHAGNIDNRTNTIIEHISEEVDNEFTLPEVSRLIEATMEVAEQRWRAGQPIHLLSDPQETIEDIDTTLTPNHETFDDTLIAENDAVTAKVPDDSTADTAKYDCGKGVPQNESMNIHSENKESGDDGSQEKQVELPSADGTGDKCNLSLEADEVFEDCVEDVTAVGEDKVDSTTIDNYSIEMKIALGVEDPA